VKNEPHDLRFFIAWAPNPDPLYHKAEESPIEMPIRPALPRASIPVDGYMLSLDHLIGGRAKKKFRDVAEKHGLHKVLKYDGPIMLDSGGYQNKHRKPLEVLEFQSKFRPNLVIHMDALGDYKKTLRNALITKEHESSFNFKIYYAIQGLTLQQYKKCAERLLKIGCENFALGNLAYLSYLRRITDIYERVLLVKKTIRNRPLHILGVSNPELIINLRGIIDSFDSSTGVRNATRLREIFLWDGKRIQYIRKPKERPSDFSCDCPICEKFDIFKNEYEYPRGTGQRRRIRFSRAIHNTFILWKATHNDI